MEATKFTVTFTVEALSLASVPSLVREAIDQMGDTEAVGGSVIKEDGDQIVWATKKKKVEF